MAYDYGVRQGLRSKGIADTDIGYDPNSGQVTVKGQNFMKPELNIQGTTFTSQPSFETAYSQYQKGQKQQMQPGITVAQQPPSMIGTAYQTNAPTATQPYNPSDQYTRIIQDIMSRANAPQQDVYSTPQYAAAQAQQQRAAQQGIRSAQEALGSAGFGRSTTLGEAANRAQNQANEYLQLQLVPQIQQQLAAQRQNELSNQMALLSPILNQLQREDQLKQQQISNAMAQAQLTGTYIPQGTQELISQLVGLKQQAEAAGTAGATAGEMAGFRSQGDILRNQLAGMGLDISGLGAETSASNVRIPHGIQTLQAKQIERRDFESDRQFEFAKAQQEWENNLKQGQFDWNQAQQAWENAFKEKDFERSMNEAAASRGLQWASLQQRDKEFIADQAFREKQFEFEKEQAGAKTQTEQTGNAAYSEFLTDLPRIGNRDEGLSLVELYRQDGVDESTLQNMLKAINSKFKE